MKILTLFLALFLTLLPEGVPAFNSFSQEQDVLLEEVNEIEEEAVISTSQRLQKRFQSPSITIPRVTLLSINQVFIFIPVHICLGRQWLLSCSLRL